MKKPVLAAGAAAAVAAPFAYFLWKYYPRPGPVGNYSVPDPAKAVDLSRYMGAGTSNIATTRRLSRASKRSPRIIR